MELPRGMKDFDEIDSDKIDFIRTQFIGQAKTYGFSFMDPSPIELLSVLETKSGSGIREEIYHFRDKADREIALRFDFTMGLTRFVTSHKSLKLPAKLAAFGGVFRYDEPQKGRYRFFHQWDIEFYGKQNLESEAEIIEFTSKFFRRLNLSNIIIDINSRVFVESFIESIFGSRDTSLVLDILRAIDKIQKKSRDEILKEFSKKGYPKDKLEKIINFSLIKGSIQEIEAYEDLTKIEGWDQLRELFSNLENRGVSNIRINFGIVRGLDYYSGTVFEVFDLNSDIGALAGGGRYDSLTNAFGREDIGASGVAGGVERIIIIMDKQKAWRELKTKKISILYTNDDMQKIAIQLSSHLRDKSVITDIDLTGKQFKKQIEMASKSKYAIIIGPKEMKDKNIILKDMETGKESQLPIKEMINDPRKFLI